MVPPDTIRVIDHAIPPAILRDVAAEVGSFAYQYGWKSSRHLDPFAHWNHRIIAARKRNTTDQRHLLRRDIYPAVGAWLDWLTTVVVGPNALLRLYANAHTYGIEGYPHTDTSRDRGETTVLMYCNDEWDPAWGGETVVFDADYREIALSVLPRFGRIFLFPSNRMHAARGLTRACPVQRVTLVAKLGPLEDADEPRERPAGPDRSGDGAALRADAPGSPARDE